MTAPGQAVAASPAHHVALAADDVAGMKIGDVRPGFHYLTDKFVADGHGHGNRPLRPVVPFVNVTVASADPGAAHEHHHVVHPSLGSLDIFEPQPRLTFAL